MMKKILSFLLAATTIFAVASCQNDKLDAQEFGSSVQVTMSLGVQDGLATRADLKGGADQLVYAVYSQNGGLLSDIGMVTVDNAFQNGAENISLSLVKGETYTVAFWAQNSACDAYTVAAGAESMTVDVNYAGGNNDETRDAFFASQTFTVSDATALEVYLKRPFAQINLGVTEEDWNAALSAGINVTKSKVVIKSVPTTLDLLDGSVAGEAVVTYDFASVPSVETKASSTVKDLVVNEESYKWLSMSYVLADEAKSTLDSDGLQFSLVTDNGNVIVVDEGLNNVPLQRNWTTNVCGTVLTSEVDLTVSTDQGFFYVANVSTVEEFKAALADRNVPEIILAAGEYDGVFVHNTMKKTIRAASGAQVVVSGKIGVSAPVEFYDIAFKPSANSQVETGHAYLDRYERKSIVPVYAVKAKFEGCTFTGLYDTDCVVAINYGAHKQGTMLEVNNCSFQGYAYAIYSRALVSVTNSTFDQWHSNVYPRAIFLYGLGDGSQGQVVFKNNVAVNKTSYTMQMMSGNYDYRNINYDVQGNTNFDVDGEAFLPQLDRDFTGTKFAEGSMTFKF